MGKDFPIDVPISSWTMRLRQDINLRGCICVLRCDSRCRRRHVYAADLCTVGRYMGRRRGTLCAYSVCVFALHLFLTLTDMDPPEMVGAVLSSVNHCSPSSEKCNKEYDRETNSRQRYLFTGVVVECPP